MTINYGPQCTCLYGTSGGYSLPCPWHGMYRVVCPPTTTTTSGGMVYSVCQGRHCAHDDRCNRYVTRNGV